MTSIAPVPDRDILEQAGGLTRPDTETLAMAYVLCRAFGTIRPGGALERWGRNAAGGGLDPLALVLAAVLRCDGPAAARAVSTLRFKEASGAAQARHCAARLATLTRSNR